MKIKKRDLIIVALALVSLATVLVQPAALARGQRKKEVRVYFWSERASTTANPFGVSAVKRMVEGKEPARGALEALLRGPNASEKKQGYLSLAVEEFDIGSLTIRGGTARVNFVASRTWPGWPGDMSPGRFREAVTRTLKQFPTVRRVVVAVNGDPKFDSNEG
ncbi:MAG: GerMN domain-containing protein [Pyrinomonadaceae bacterium]|nr:GerMN domain-containing protein [Pyrinomonadaceae bacterium]